MKRLWCWRCQAEVAMLDDEEWAFAREIQGPQSAALPPSGSWHSPLRLPDRLWTVRGWLDLLTGGVGMRRGRRDPVRLQAGDVLDGWRVERVEPDASLRLRAEMKLPGRAWLEFRVQPRAGGAELRQTATFDPRGLAGILYWYGMWPLHQLVFAGLLRAIAHAAETSDDPFRRVGRPRSARGGPAP